ncbi:peptidylprolyl isomerase [Vibrio salinus]|uniref:peptidylprolyl isomerase n=1 Tax=Vibrio salinus TaxID=2899784 RepID=UPI001E3EF93F|nr:peptidylprolyl isomerase [Vibrio salinus]MCE0492885.1 peptidylprolyl isomerase [Vibrio salinus]
MMDRLREGANSIAIKIILGIIILSFVFAGVSSYLVSGSNNAAAKVGGVKISRTEFEQAYQNERNRMQTQLGDYFSNRLADPGYVASLRQSVLNRMINDVLIEQHANSLGLRVSDAQVSKEILDIPQFQSKGKFDQDIYKNALARAGFTPDSFASYIRNNLLRDQLLQAVQRSEFALKNESESQAALIAQKRTIRTITLDVNEFAKKVVLNEDEIKTFYNQHKEDFTRPEQLKLSYIELSAAKLKNSIAVSDKTAKDYYQQHLDQYSTKDQREVSHILIKGDDKKTAEAVLKEIQDGANFADVAKKRSQDPASASKGGNLGWIEKGVMDPAFEKGAFSLKHVGDMTGLVKSSFGYHIIKLDALKKAQAKPFAQVKDEVVESIKQEKAVDKFYSLQNELEKVAFESPDSLDPSAEKIHGKVIHTDYVSLDNLPKILSSASVKEAINHDEVKSEGLNSSVIEVAPEDVVVVRVDDVRPEAVLPLGDVKDSVKTKLAQDKAQDQAKALAEKVIKSLSKGDTSVLKGNNLDFSAKEVVDRNSPLANAVFEMKKPEKNKVIYRQTSDQKGDVVIVELSKVESHPQESLVHQVRIQLNRLNQQQDLSGILSVLRSNAKIESYIATK